MKVDKTNYETLALDYLEGALSKEKCREFEEFLADNKEVAREIALLQEGMPTLLLEEVSCPHKATLKRGKKRVWFAPLVSLTAAAVVVLGLLLFQQQPVLQDEVPAGLAMQRVVVSTDSAAAPAKQQVAPKVLAMADPMVSVKRQPKVLVVKKQTIESTVSQLNEDKVRHYTKHDLVLGDATVRMMQDSVSPLKVDATDANWTPVQPSAIDVELVAQARSEAERAKIRSGMRRGFAALLLAPLDNITPIRRFKTPDKSGLQIASLCFVREKIEPGTDNE